MMRWIGILVLGLALLLVPSVALAATSEEVTVTATGYICGAPGGLTLTYINDYEVGISWTKGPDAENTMVRAKYGSTPESRTDGYLVYYGNGTNCSDTGVSLEETTVPVYYKLWSENAGGIWEESGISDFFTGGGMTLIALLVLMIGLSALAMRSSFLLLKLMAGVGWVAMFVYWMYSPPAAITAGSPPHIAIMLVFIGMAVAIPLVGLGREVSTQKDWRSGLDTETSGAFHFKLPDWLRGSETINTEKRRQDTSEYRRRLHSALNPSRRTEK